MAYTLADIARIVDGTLYGNKEAFVSQHYFDSRNIVPNKTGAFWGFKGKVDGSSFVLEAYENGVKTFITERKIEIPEDASLIVVSDTKKALQKLAAYHLTNSDIKTVGITGSNGKTIVKEWLFQCLYSQENIIRSPKSYNSQIGLPLSILETKPDHTLGIFEVGISKPGEMDLLQEIFHPDIGVLTNIRESHIENFESYEDLVFEKMKLFQQTKNLVYHVDLQNYIDASKFEKTCTFGDENAAVFISKAHQTEVNHTEVILSIHGEKLSAVVPFSDRASLENIQCVVATLSIMGFSNAFIAAHISKLHPLEMRLEIRDGSFDSVLIRDEFILDYPSLEIALSVLNQQNKERKVLILSDFDLTEMDESQVQRVIALLNGQKLSEIYLVGIQFIEMQDSFTMPVSIFKSTKDLIHFFQDSSSLKDSAVLIKGARKYGFEALSEHLEKKSHETSLEVSLHHLMLNFNYFKDKLKPTTKIMAMVKANAYGLGLDTIAHTLAHYGVDYLGVAYADEGEQLKNLGIKTPIMVMNPDVNAFEKIIENRLEPELYSFRVLKDFISLLKRKSLGYAYPIHIKIDTGMHRLGFLSSDIPSLSQILTSSPYIEVKSVLSHLSSSDNEEDKAYTEKQLERFNSDFTLLTMGWKRQPERHILNSHGVLRYPDYQMDMVRLGIGLYDGTIHEDLHTVAQLKTIISQLKFIEKGESVGYNRKFIASKGMKIAILPIGYADGVSRKLYENNYQVLICDTLCPVVGVVCMDMMMVDVSEVSCAEGDEVLIFGNAPNLKEFAKASETITYDCLTAISSRIRRVYYKE